ncbi:MAG: DNA-3-methyladenine glycosylase 2 family protein [Nocardioidaceae bacterium]
MRSLRRGGSDPTFQRDADGTVWRSATTPGGRVTARIRSRRGEGVVELETWGAGAEWMLEQSPAMLGADDVTAPFFTPAEPRVRAAWRRDPHWRVPRTGLVLEALLAAVIEQKVTGQEAWLGWRRLITRFGSPAPGPGEARGMWCPPTASELSRIPSWEWLRCSIDGARSHTIVSAARVAAALERTLALPLDEVEARLMSLPGVGAWTAAEVRQRAHGDPDAVSFGDYHVATHVGWALRGTPMNDLELEQFLAPERPHRYRIQHIVISRLAGRPRRGPKRPPRRHLPR